MDGCIADLMEVPDKENDMTGHKRYVVPEGYMLDETEFEGIIAMLRSVRGSQCRLDEVCDKLMTGVRKRLAEVTCGKRRKGQV